MRAALSLLLVLFVVELSAMGFPHAKRKDRASVCQNQGVDPGEPLLLSPLIEKGMFKEAMEQSKAVLDGVDLGHSGYLTVPTKSGKYNNNMWFWFIPCMNCANISESPLIMWMQGGPGGASSYGNTNEIGPFYIDGNCSIKRRTYTWCDPYASCIFFDNPIQTGFSFQTNSTGQTPEDIEYTETSAENGVQLTQALLQFFKVFTPVAESPFYLMGESYGGNYVPNLALSILKNAPSINLKGVNVGDPIMNSIVQYPTYPDTLYGMGLVNIAQREKLRSILEQATEAMLTQSCRAGFNFWNSIWNDNQAEPQPFYYQTFTGSSTTYEQLLATDPASFAWSGDWLATNQVQKALHYGGIPPNPVKNEGGPVYQHMVDSGDYCQNSSDLYGSLLTEYGLNVQIYSSTNDPLLGPPCTEAGIMAMMGKVGLTSQFLAADRVLWREDVGGLHGYATCFVYQPKNARFCYPVIRNAGHMSPVFQPRANMDMTMRFLNNIPFTETSVNLPSGPPCSGAAPFAGQADPACVCGAGK